MRELRARRASEQFRITQYKETERAFTGRYLHNKESGVYACVACDAGLFASDTKYDSGSGWPSFWLPLAGDRVVTHRDVATAWCGPRSPVRTAAHISATCSKTARALGAALLRQLGRARIQEEGLTHAPIFSALSLPVAAVVLACGTLAGCARSQPPAVAPANQVAALEVTELVVGQGAAATPGSRVTVHYTGWMYDHAHPDAKGTEFDSSRRSVIRSVSSWARSR